MQPLLDAVVDSRSLFRMHLMSTGAFVGSVFAAALLLEQM